MHFRTLKKFLRLRLRWNRGAKREYESGKRYTERHDDAFHGILRPFAPAARAAVRVLCLVT